MTLEWLLGWWNLIFVAPFVVALLYLGITTISGIGMSDAADLHTDVDADADAHVEVAEVHADVDADADLHADVNADADADVDTDTDHVADASGGGPSFYALALSWLGVGRVPISLLLIVFMLIWGVAGFVTNAMMQPKGGWEAAKFSVPVALLCSLLVTRSLVMFMSRYMPLNETSAQPRRALVGRLAEALYPIDQTFGMAVLHDSNASLQQVSCRVAPGVEPIEKGKAVKLIAYNATDQTFYVAAMDPKPGVTPARNETTKPESPSNGRGN